MPPVLSAVLHGIDGIPVEVEVRLSAQLPRIDLVGLPEAAVRESAARVRAAVAAAGYDFPDRRVTVNLAPAALPKSGAGLDLPIAIGILAAAGSFEPKAVERVGLLGELALDGRLRPVRGALALSDALRRAGCDRIVVPLANGGEAALARDARVFAAPDLASVLGFLATGAGLEAASPPAPAGSPTAGPDLCEVRGHERAKRALVIAAAGGHGLFLSGPPGSGKTLLASCLPSLLSPLRFGEALEVSRIHSAAGQLDAAMPLAERRPFRAPHHSATRAGMLGGGNPPRPGEVSLAHRGVLFLDEFPEFDRSVREALRQVLEQRCVALARAQGRFEFPADFQLVAAANPCPCGWRGSRWRRCRCSDLDVRRYTSRLSGPLLDRIDLSLRVPALRWRELAGSAPSTSSAQERARIAAARSFARPRLEALTLRCNAELPVRGLEATVAATAEARTLLGRAVDRLRLTARGAHRALRVARTVADLSAEAQVTAGAIAEAVSYRDLDDGARESSRWS